MRQVVSAPSRRWYSLFASVPWLDRRGTNCQDTDEYASDALHRERLAIRALVWLKRPPAIDKVMPRDGKETVAPITPSLA